MADEITTLPSYLAEQSALEEEAASELPLECTQCTHEFGAVKQEVYQCITCREENQIQTGMEESRPNGICYACHIMCHAEHEVVEMGMLRGWTCDCGTARMEPAACTLATKTFTKTLSGTNRYTPAFGNTYCICNGPDIGDMIQCHLCEDWYHFECIMSVSLPTDKEDVELLCRRCISQHPWLSSYAYSARVGLGLDGKVQEWKEIALTTPSSVTAASVHSTDCQVSDENCSPNTDSLDAAADQYLMELDALPAKSSKVACLKPKLPSIEKADKVIYDFLTRPSFWTQFCHCDQCSALYHGTLAFIKQPELDVAYVPPLSAPVPTEADLMNIVTTTLSSTQQRNVGYAMNNLRDKLREFLIPYAQNDKVVSTEDVKKWSQSLLEQSH